MYAAERSFRKAEWFVHSVKKKKGKQMAKHYSVYERTTDKPIVIYGTPEECAKALGISRDSFYSKVAKARSGSRKPVKYEIFEDKENDDDGVLEI